MIKRAFRLSSSAPTFPFKNRLLVHNTTTTTSKYIPHRFHSNWEQIKKHKSDLDLKKCSERSKLCQSIGKAVRQGYGGPDVNLNSWLARLVQEAKKIDMPKRLIEETIQKAAASLKSNSSNSARLLFEGRYKQFYFLIECEGYNNNSEDSGSGGEGAHKRRLEQQIRKILQDSQGQIYDSADGSNNVKWMFQNVAAIEMYAPLNQTEFEQIHQSVIQILDMVREQPRLRTSTPDTLINNIKKINQPRVIIPRSIDFDDLMLESLERGADDIYIVNIPAWKALHSFEADIPFSAVPIHLRSLISSIQSVQAVCRPENLLKYVQQLNAQDRPWNLTQRSDETIIVKPHIFRQSVMWIPSLDQYDSDAIWQWMPPSSSSSPVEGVRGGGSSDGIDCKNIETILRKLKECEQVVTVWHNIREVEPFHEYQFESQMGSSVFGSIFN